MALSVKSRDFGTSLVIPTPRLYFGGVPAEPASEVILPNPSIQVTESEPHRKAPSGHYDSGGPFYTCKRVIVGSIPHISFEQDIGSPFVQYKYKGPIFPGPYTLWYNDFLKSDLRDKDLSDLDSIGATAIANASPVSPVDTLGQGLLENYHDGLPNLPGIRTWQKRLGIIKSAGDEFLNAVFGWEPLVSEVKDFASTVRDSRDILKQYHENQGTNVHREFRFPIDDSEVTEQVTGITNPKAECGTGFGGDGESNPGIPGKIFRTVTQRRSVWFSGSFTYAVPSQTDTWRRMLGYGSDADKLFGIALTPELLWNLTPWSWAVDWFSNAGDVLTNISNFAGAGQVMRYGYVMEEISTKVRYTMDISNLYIHKREVPVPTIEFERTSKVRRPANPYGFGVTLSSLSPLQIAIAAAVGISLL